MSGGNYETVVYAGSINYQDAKGRWQPIDDTLVPSSASGYAYQNKANSYSSAFPKSLADNPVHFAGPAGFVDVALVGAQGTVSASRNMATYANAFPGLTVSYVANRDSLKESLQLASAASPNSFVYRIHTSAGLSVRQLQNGAIAFVDKAQKVQYAFALPYMYDSTNTLAGFSREVHVTLGQDASGQIVTVTADPGWLKSTARKYPVVIDPTIWTNVNYYGGYDCFIQNTNPNFNFCSSALYTGIADQVGFDGASVNRALLSFPVQTGYTHIVPNSNIIDAELDLTLASSSVGGAVAVTADPITQAWNDNYTTWNNRDNATAWSTPGGVFSSAVDTENIGPTAGSYRFIHLTQTIQNWVNGNATNYGFLLKASNEGAAGLLKFDNQAFDPINSTNPNLPHLRIQWNNFNGLQPWYTYETHALSDRTSLAVNVANGNLVVNTTDVAIKGTGLDLHVDRYYNSLADASGWHIGKGWNVGVGCDVRLDLDDFDGITYHGPDGYAVLFPSNGSGGWSAPAGLDADLVKNGDSTYTLTRHQNQEKFNFQTGGCLQNMVDRYGNTISMSYNGSLQSITDTQSRLTSFTYSSPVNADYISQITDASGRTFKYVYNTNGDLTTYTDANGKNTQYSYNANDQLSQIIDPIGNTTNITYGTTYPYKVTQIGYLNASCSGGSCNTGFTYGVGAGSCTANGVFGNTVETDADAHATTYCLDNAGRALQVIDPNASSRQSSYTSDHQLASGTDALSQTTTGTYNSNNNVTQVTYPVLRSGESPATVKNGFATPSSVSGYPFLPSSMTDAQGRCTAYIYNSGGELTDLYEGQTSPCDGQSAGTHTSYAYQGDPGVSCGGRAGERCSAKDALGNTTSYAYDSNGNLISVAPPSPLGATTIVPDALSRSLSVTDGKGQKRTYAYDALDRVTQILYNGATICTPSAGNCISYVYDGDGNRTSMTDNTGTTSYFFDTLNRLTTESPPDAAANCAGSSPAGITFGYDAVGNLTQSCDSSGTTTYSYDAANRPTAVAEPGGSCGPTPSLCTTFSYNANGQRTQTAFPGGATLNIGYDSNWHVTAMVGKDKNGAVLTSFSYTYNNGTSDTQFRQTHSENDPVANNTYTYSYDVLNRLAQATVTGGVGTSYTYGYDANGNLVRKTAGSSTTSFAYNAGNELCWAYSGLSSNSCAAPPSGATTYSFDANGNQTGNSAGGSFSYNPKNQTTAITNAGTTLSPLAYSGPDQALRTVAGATAFDNSVQGVQLQTTNGTGSYYLRDGKGNLLGERVAGIHYYYLIDSLGSIVAVISGDGLTIGDRYSYDPYGNTTYQSGTVANAWGYAGGFTDATGLIKFGTRYYVPTIGQFSQTDPAGGSTSQYLYAGDNPINARDPSGLYWWWCDWSLCMIDFNETETRQIENKVLNVMRISWILTWYDPVFYWLPAELQILNWEIRLIDWWGGQNGIRIYRYHWESPWTIHIVANHHCTNKWWGYCW